ncbi:MAG: hypothetical protein OXE81_12815 [Gammaproteobacteria bacterium]|nr:hypothetical protein [Gammaproteobacteria bacterium]
MSRSARLAAVGAVKGLGIARQCALPAGAKMSMDGQVRYLDNIFIERLWRSLKYECVCLHELEDGRHACGLPRPNHLGTPELAGWP